MKTLCFVIGFFFLCVLCDSIFLVWGLSLLYDWGILCFFCMFFVVSCLWFCLFCFPLFYFEVEVLLGRFDGCLEILGSVVYYCCFCFVWRFG